jgi:hypothetical protein
MILATVSIISSIPGLQCSISSTTVTQTRSTCEPRPRVTQTVISTATITSCPDPLVCPRTSDSINILTSSSRLTFQSSSLGSAIQGGASSSECIPTLYGSLCYNCGLTPKLISTRCNSASSPSSVYTSSSASSPALSQTPLCPDEASGRLYAGLLGGIYGIYCGIEYTDRILGQAFRQEAFLNCISACDAYNIVHFNEASPCRGVSYYESISGDNCFLKSGVLGPVIRPGVDSARLMNPQVPGDNSTISIITVTTTASATSTQVTGPGTGPPVIITQNPGTGEFQLL